MQARGPHSVPHPSENPPLPRACAKRAKEVRMTNQKACADLIRKGLCDMSCDYGWCRAVEDAVSASESRSGGGS